LLAEQGREDVLDRSAIRISRRVRQADQPIDTGGFSATFPASSITLFELPQANVLVTPWAYIPMARR